MTESLLPNLGDLIGVGPVHRSTLPMLDDASWQALVTAGAVTRSPLADEILCEACDAGHFGRPEWLPGTGGYAMFCPNAGYVAVENDDMSRFELQSSWWIEALASALSIVSPRLEPLIAAEAWYLGKAIHGGIEWGALCMTGPVSATRLDTLIQHINRLPVLPVTVIVTFASTIPRQMLAKQKIWFLRLADVAALDLHPSPGFQVDRLALTRCLQGFERGQSRPVRPGGSPGKNRVLVDEAIAKYRTKHGAFENKTDAAKEILESLRQAHGDIRLPKVGTLRNRLAEFQVHETA